MSSSIASDTPIEADRSGPNVLSTAQQLSYALPAVPMALPTLAVYIWLPTFYAEQTQLTLLQAGTALLLARLLDLLSDLAAGRYCDRSILGLPRRRGWMLLGLLLASPALLMLFDPPSEAGWPRLLLLASLLYVGWTLIQIPWQAWLVDLCPDSSRRLRLCGWREGAGLLGLLLSAALPVVLLENGATLRQALTTLALAALVLALPCALLLSRLPEPKCPVGEPTHSWRDLWQLRLNRLWLRLLAAWGLNTLANGIAAVLFPLAVSIGFGGDDRIRVWLLLLYFGAALIALPLWSRSRLELHRLWGGAMMMAALVFLLVPLLPADHVAGLWGFALVCVLTGVVLGADLALPPVMQANLVDWDRWRFGKERALACFAGHSMVMKLSLGAAAALAPALLWLLADGEDLARSVDPSRRFELLVIYAWLPCVLKLSAVALLWRYPLSRRRHRMITMRLQRQSPA
ncbi:MFS transporter [Motiliproteus coralliicola]|uniref:MFS transporter n=1 Tax=Motiliproteus coralliicola TaxID=2283196 RepID=A0A369WRW5_9GAMM|nr:MFS transporter [Motiliproteus coralliicola]RDE24868.1 MFS transporter [Motiliproteus coralliicola]